VVSLTNEIIALRNCDITVAVAAPPTPHLKYFTNRISRTTLVIDEIIK
jgi:hypothetical protein